MRYVLSPECFAQVQGLNPNQTLFFCMNSRGKHAVAVSAGVAKDVQERAARALKGCVRVGHVVSFTIDGVTFTVAETV